MRTLLAVVILLSGCGPDAPTQNANGCLRIETPLGCPTVWRITDPQNGTVLYVSKSGGVASADKCERPAEKK